MNIEILVSDLLLVMIEIYLYYDFMNGILEKKVMLLSIKICIETACFIALFAIEGKEPFMLNIIAVPVIYYVVGFLTISDNWKRRLGYSLVIFVIGGGIRICFPIWVYRLFGISEGQLCNPYYRILIFVLLMELITFFILKLAKYGIRIRKATLRKENLVQQHYEKLDEENQTYLQTIHNLNYYFETIGQLAISGQSEKILGILEEIDIKIHGQDISSFCSNSILDAILTEKWYLTKMLGIEFSIFVEPTVNLEFMKEIDLISIFENLISNAIEATQKCERKCIDMQVYMHENSNQVIFKIENTFAIAPQMNGMIFETTKSDRRKHGIGILDVRKTVAKYNGYMNIKIEKELFKVAGMISD